MRVSKAFKLKKTQAELDFVDVDTDFDLKLFIDPYAIEIRGDDFSIDLQDHISTYFQFLLDTLRSGKAGLASQLTSHLSEPDETFIGVSKGGPGKGVGPKQAAQIIGALRRSTSFKTGVLTDLAETELFIPGISSDKLSDLTTNIIRFPLEAYTLAQCELLEIPTQQIAMPPAWNPQALRWEAHYGRVPMVDKKPVLFIPKTLVRRKLALDSQEFYSHHMINYLQEEELRKDGPLVRVMKKGGRRVLKADLKAIHPFDKTDLEAFARSHAGVLEFYKKLKGAVGSLGPADFDKNFSETAFAQALKSHLANIPPGMKAASEYHSFMIGVLSFLFYPDLISPKKEDPQHEGRKKVDITFINAARDGFFFRTRTWPRTAALQVFFECKNYSEDVKNPELDQLSSRFGHNKGNLGFLVCRTIEERAKFTASCKDTAKDGRGFVIALDDQEIGRLLDLVKNLSRSSIPTYLDARLKEITT